MTESIRIARDRTLTQIAAAKRPGLSRLRMSELMHEKKLETCSSDALVESPANAGVKVTSRAAGRVA